MTIKTWFKNLRQKITIKLSNLFLSIAYFFVKKENPEDPFVWFKNTFGIDSAHVLEIITKSDVGPFYGRKTVKMTDKEYMELLDQERKESVKLHSMFKSRLVPHFNPEAIEKHNERIKDFPNDFNLAALMKREEVEGDYLLRKMVRPTDIMPPKDRLIK